MCTALRRDRPGGDAETIECWSHKGDIVLEVVGELGLGEKGQWEVENVRRLHGPQQGMLEGLLPSAEH